MKNRLTEHVLLLLAFSALLNSCKRQLAEDILGTWTCDIVVTYDDGTKEFRTIYDTFENDDIGKNMFKEYVFCGNSVEKATPQGEYLFFSSIKGKWKIESGNLYKEYDLSSLEIEMGRAYREYDKDNIYKSMFYHYKELAGKTKYPLKNLMIDDMELSYDEGNIDRTVYKKANSIEKYIKPTVGKKSVNTSVNSQLDTSIVSESTKAILESRIAEWDCKCNFDIESAVNNLYAKSVRFYGRDCGKLDIKKTLIDFMNKNSDFQQESNDIRFTPINKVTVRCDFTKTTFSNGNVKNYPSYLYFQNINGLWLITQESDAVTDHNLSKKK